MNDNYSGDHAQSASTHKII